MDLQSVRRQVAIFFHKGFAKFYLAWGYRFFDDQLMVITTIGCKSGQPRIAPVGYAKIGNYVYTLTRATPPISNWIRNVKQNPQVELKLGEKWITTTGDVLENPDQVRQVMRLFLKRRPGYSRFLEINLDSSEEELESAAKKWQAVRFQVNFQKGTGKL
jgi:deazaflavin-dependent oxidoreductase (nitroreductase family)